MVILCLVVGGLAVASAILQTVGVIPKPPVGMRKQDLPRPGRRGPLVGLARKELRGGSSATRPGSVCSTRRRTRRRERRRTPRPWSTRRGCGPPPRWVPVTLRMLALLLLGYSPAASRRRVIASRMRPSASSLPSTCSSAAAWSPEPSYVRTLCVRIGLLRFDAVVAADPCGALSGRRPDALVLRVQMGVSGWLPPRSAGSLRAACAACRWSPGPSCAPSAAGRLRRGCGRGPASRSSPWSCWPVWSAIRPSGPAAASRWPSRRL